MQVLLDTDCSVPLLIQKTAEKLGIQLVEHEEPLIIESYTGQQVTEAGKFFTPQVRIRVN